MPKIVKLNYDRKVRYLFDKDTEECERLSEQVMDHYGQFLETPHGWWMEDIKRFQKVLRECGLSVNEFLREEFEIPKKKSPTKKKPVVKKVPVEKEEKVVKKKTVKRKTSMTKKKTPVKKPTVTKKKVPVKKKTPIKKKPAKKVA
jgi:hypothetical protein